MMLACLVRREVNRTKEERESSVQVLTPGGKGQVPPTLIKLIPLTWSTGGEKKEQRDPLVQSPCKNLARSCTSI